MKTKTISPQQAKKAIEAIQPLRDKLDEPTWTPTDLARWIESVSDALKNFFPTLNFCDEFNSRMPQPEASFGFYSTQSDEVVMANRYTDTDVKVFEEDGRRFAITLLNGILSELNKL